MRATPQRRIVQVAAACAALLAVGFTVTACTTAGTEAATTAHGRWRFAVSGDSRNCGNLVMPAIAAGARLDGAAFYWHLGDLRWISDFDQDFVRESRYQGPGMAPTRADYLNLALPDFLEHQVKPFGDLPFFVGIGNHETRAPATRLQFRAQMKDLLDRPELAAQRRADALPAAESAVSLPPTYYHWQRGGVDFIYLDNATADAFDEDQLAWLDAVLRRDQADATVRSLVVGMHEALPHSLGDFHSMCATPQGIQTGERVYRALAALQVAGKHVYVLASHSHFYLANVFDTPYWRAAEHGGVVLPGWIVGTAGAERYPLPPGVRAGPGARALAYGYLAATVDADGSVSFEFRDLDRAALSANRSADLPEDLVQWCVEQNPPAAQLERPLLPTSCDLHP